MSSEEETTSEEMSEEMSEDTCENEESVANVCNDNDDREKWKDALDKLKFLFMDDIEGYEEKQMEDDDLGNINPGSDGERDLLQGEIEHCEGAIQRETLPHVSRLVWARFEEILDGNEDEIVELVAQEDSAEKDLIRTDGTMTWCDDFTKFKGTREKFKRLTAQLAINYKDPYEVFCVVWDRQIMEKIAIETNRYAQQTIAITIDSTLKTYYETWHDTDADELYILFAIFIIIGLRIGYHDFWSAVPRVGLTYVRHLISYERYMLLRRFIHFVDNSTLTELKGNNINVSKIQPIADHCSKKFESLYTLQQNITIGESMSLFRGESLHKYLDVKATGEAKRIYELCDASNGYVWRVLAHPGINADTINKDNCTANIVLKLTEGICNRGHTLLMDNCYNSVLLSRYLKQQGTDVLGTIRAIREHIPQEIKDLDKMKKRLRKEKRGQNVARHCKDVAIYSWVGLKNLHVISTYLDFSSVERVGEYIKRPKEAVYMPMEGVDFRDETLSEFFLEKNRTSKWYVQSFMRLLNVSIWNTYILVDDKKTVSPKESRPHQKFRSQLIDLLLDRHMSDDVRTRIGEALRLTKHRHYLRSAELSRECARCKARGVLIYSDSACDICKVALCTGQCYEEYHTLKML